ncbi:EpsG family protein [Priestia megaterium]|uniref:EpsG family protein n=1 Tax=Priestia megaterium TaxID=1404 RepID=UPI002E218690|nr:EpsG family protein [Priestia megaterium]
MIYIATFVISTLLFLGSQLKTEGFIEKRISNTIFLLPALLILIFFLGLRMDVGRDYEMYSNIFYLGYGAEKELGFKFINELFMDLGFPFYSVLLFMAVLSISFFYKILKRQSSDVKALTFLTFWLSGPYIYLFNVVRQGLTNLIFMYVLNRYVEKKYIHVIALIIFASLFHLSILFIILLLPLLVKKYNKRILYILFFLSLLLNFMFNIQPIFIKFLSFVPYFGDIYGQATLLDAFVKRSSFGLGYLFRFILVFLTIMQYEKLSQDKKLLPYVNSFVVWGILKILTLQVWIIERQLDYLLFAVIIVVPRLIKSFESRIFRRLLGTLIMIGLFLLFLMSTILASPDDKMMPYNWGI